MLRSLLKTTSARAGLALTLRASMATQASALLKPLGIHVRTVHRNASVPVLYENALKSRVEPGSAISSTGALIAFSGSKTGRSPKDKRVVKEETSEDKVWWGNVNVPLSEDAFAINRNRAVDYLNTRDELYIVDGIAGADPKYAINIRIVCARPYHALFMHNMLIRPTAEQLKTFKPDFTILNAGNFPANTLTDGMSSETSVDVNFKEAEMVILGTQYAGEMKKGVFTLMHYLMPTKHEVLSLHSSANEGVLDGKKNVSVFFGLSGTGKTTLSADPHRSLIGDDEHVWTDDGIFNIEGGCYAKAIDLSPEGEPEIFNAIKFGSVLENVVFDEDSHEVDYSDTMHTENTRCSYPIDYIPNAKVPSVAGHPDNIIFLTCDASGSLPPVSKLTEDQAMYHFISGYTAKMPGTEMGVQEATNTFSACFGEAFLVRHPTVYAEMLKSKMQEHSANAWLINTGWTGGKFGSKDGKRIPLRYTRAIIDAIHSGELETAETKTLPIFNLEMPVKCKGVPEDILDPSLAWDDKTAHAAELKTLAEAFNKNFESYADAASDDIKAAAPQL